jgi:hypothetical protein
MTRRLTARLGVARPPVLRQTQRDVVVRPADESRGRLAVPSRQQQQADVVAP